MGIFSLGILNAQVGVNTKTPLGVLHIDPAGNTNAAGTSGTGDDIVVKSNGQVGIGTISPAKTLDLRGKFKLVDGTQFDGYFLTSDVDGNGSWKKTMQMKGFVNGVTKFPSEFSQLCFLSPLLGVQLWSFFLHVFCYSIS